MTLPSKVTANASQERLAFAFGSFLQTFCRPPQAFLINPSRRTTIVGQLGTRLTFFPGSFIDSEGGIVTKDIAIQLTEIFTKDEMVFSGLPTTSEDRLLESAGQFKLVPVLGETVLALKKPVAVELPVRDIISNPIAMRLFKGSRSSTRAFKSGFDFDWKQEGTKPLSLAKNIGKRYFQFSIDAFNWWNCDRFCKSRHRVMLSVKMDCPIENFEDKVAFLVFKDINAVVKMYPMGQRFTAMNIPTQMAAKIIVMGYANNQIYFGQADILRTANTMLKLPIHPIEEPDLIEQIRLLS